VASGIINGRYEGFFQVEEHAQPSREWRDGIDQNSHSGNRISATSVKDSVISKPTGARWMLQASNCASPATGSHHLVDWIKRQGKNLGTRSITLEDTTSKETSSSFTKGITNRYKPTILHAAKQINISRVKAVAF
jgi:hypothetical protein